MALFRVQVRFEQVVEIDVRASSPKEAENVAEAMVRENQVTSKDLRSSRREWVEAVAGATEVAAS